jgi:hypothetical protein
MPETKPQPPRRRCRSLTVGGIQCNACAQHGEIFCVRHVRNRFPVCPSGPRVAVPLLEDFDSVRLVPPRSPMASSRKPSTPGAPAKSSTPARSPP